MGDRDATLGQPAETCFHSILQLADQLEVHPWRKGADQSLPGWLQ